MSLSSPITPFDSEGVKWAKLQRIFRLIADNAGITYTMSFPLTDILPSDTEGIKWTKLGAWSQLIADNIGGSIGGSGTLLATFDYVGTAVINEVFGYFKAPADITVTKIQIAAQVVPVGGPINVTLVNAAGVSLGRVGVLADGAAFQETVIADLAVAAGGTIRGKFTAVDGTGGYLTVNLL